MLLTIKAYDLKAEWDQFVNYSSFCLFAISFIFFMTSFQVLTISVFDTETIVNEWCEPERIQYLQK